jgi:hypothetical protein
MSYDMNTRAEMYASMIAVFAITLVPIVASFGAGVWNIL